jgi:hypothetical protein
VGTKGKQALGTGDLDLVLVVVVGSKEHADKLSEGVGNHRAGEGKVAEGVADKSQVQR